MQSIGVKKLVYGLVMSSVLMWQLAEASSDHLCAKAFSNIENIGLDADPYDRLLAIEAMSRHGRPADKEYLLARVDPDQPFIASSAISTLAGMNDPVLNNRLYRMAAADADIAGLVIQNLQYVVMSGSEGFIKTYLNNELSPLKQVWSMKAIAKQADPAIVGWLQQRYSSYTTTPLLQSYVLYALVKLQAEMPNHSQMAVDFANNQDPLVREVAAVILGELPSSESVEQLRTLTHDVHHRVKLAALVSLAKVKEGEAKLKILQQLMLNSVPNSELLAGGVKRLPAPLAIDIINSYLASTQANGVSLRVLESLASVRGGDAVYALNWGLQKSDEGHVLQAIFALAARQQKNERSLLNSLLDSDKPSIKSSASWAYLQFPCEAANY